MCGIFYNYCNFKDFGPLTFIILVVDFGSSGGRCVSCDPRRWGAVMTKKLIIMWLLILLPGVSFALYPNVIDYEESSNARIGIARCSLLETKEQKLTCLNSLQESLRRADTNAAILVVLVFALVIIIGVVGVRYV